MNFNASLELAQDSLRQPVFDSAQLRQFGAQLAGFLTQTGPENRVRLAVTGTSVGNLAVCGTDAYKCCSTANSDNVDTLACNNCANGCDVVSGFLGTFYGAVQVYGGCEGTAWMSFLSSGISLGVSGTCYRILSGEARGRVATITFHEEL